MNRLSFRHVLVAALLTVVAGAGCQKKSQVTVSANAAKPAQPTPEESFATIVETFRRGVEDVPIGFVIQDGSGRQTMMTGRNVVTTKLLPPEKEGDPLRAEITVTSDTQYSLQQSSEKPDEGATDESDASDTEGSSIDGSDVQIFDPSVASAPGGGKRQTTSGKVDRNAVTIAPPFEIEHDERTYVLVHENGRWKLVTKLDPKTEESIQFAFDRALDSQS